MGGKIDVNSGSGKRTLTWWRLGAIAFVMTSCGPFGIEAAIDNGGVLLTLIAVLSVPILYVIPQVLMVSELSLMMPSNHGYILWVLRGWGPFHAFFAGYNGIIVNTVDLALYPVLASDYVLRLLAKLEWIPHIPDGQVEMDFSNTDYRVCLATRFILIIIGTFVASLSAANVSTISVFLCAIITGIFVLLFCWTLPSLHPAEQWTYHGGMAIDNEGRPNWGAFTAASLWLYTGWKSLGALAGDVDTGEKDSPSEVAQTDHHTGGGGPLAPETGLDAQHRKDAQATREHHAKHNVDAYYGEGNAIPPEILTDGDRSMDLASPTPQDTVSSLVSKTGLDNVFVRGLQTALFLGVIMYVMPLLTTFTSEANQAGSWSDGYLAEAMDYAVPGTFWVIITIAIVSQFGLFYSSLVCYSRIVWGLAELGWLPEILCKLHPSLGTPLAATLAQSAALIPLMFIDFSYLQRLEFTLAAVSYCLTFTAYLRLRYTEPNANRPYTVPGGMPVAWLITVTKVVVMVTVAVTNASDLILLAISVGINVCIGIAYYFGGRKRTKDLQKREFGSSTPSTNTPSSVMQSDSKQCSFATVMRIESPRNLDFEVQKPISSQ